MGKRIGQRRPPLTVRSARPVESSAAPTKEGTRLISQAEAEATIAALKPSRRRRPLIAVVGINDATELIDYLMPYGILKRADVADVVLLATEPGPVRLFPALKVEAQATVAWFDAQHPEGADVAIVPAMSRDDDPALLSWITAQATKGALIIGICAGAKVVAAAGLLDGRWATTHWYYVNEVRRRHRAVRYVADRRFVVDRGIATTTGITASMPMSVALIEAIAGREKAETVAKGLGLDHWDARHDSSAFRFTWNFAATVATNRLAFWRHERLGIELQSNVDEVSLALVADAWSRTYRSRAIAVAATADAVETRGRLRILPDQLTSTWRSKPHLLSVDHRAPVVALNDALDNIAARYGPPTADIVAMQMEYSRTQRGRGANAGMSLPEPPALNLTPE